MKTVDILRKAKEIYKSGKYFGMCDCIRNVVGDDMLLIEFDFWVQDNIPLFCYSVAREKFGATGQSIGYWWDMFENAHRLIYFDWLIEQYVELTWEIQEAEPTWEIQEAEPTWEIQEVSPYMRSIKVKGLETAINLGPL